MKKFKTAIVIIVTFILSPLPSLAGCDDDHRDRHGDRDRSHHHSDRHDNERHDDHDRR